MSALLKRLFLKFKIDSRFYLEQSWGLIKSADPSSIPKFELKKYLPEAPVVIDCGAHVGADSVELARIFPKGKIYSFEPIPQLFEHLKKNTRKFSNIQCYKLALSDRDGEAEMYVSSGASDASSSLLPPQEHLNDHTDVHFETRIQVLTRTLDSWAKEHSVRHIDFLWLDMQGFEFRMLEETSMLSNVKAIHTEVSLKAAYADSVLYPRLKEWLQGLGFKVLIEAIPVGADMGNVLFVRQ